MSNLVVKSWMDYSLHICYRWLLHATLRYNVYVSYIHMSFSPLNTYIYQTNVAAISCRGMGKNKLYWHNCDNSQARFDKKIVCKDLYLFVGLIFSFVVSCCDSLWLDFQTFFLKKARNILCCTIFGFLIFFPAVHQQVL